MALTAGAYPVPIKPYGGVGGTLTAPELVLPLDDAETILQGDIMVVNQTTFDLEDRNAATGATAVERIFGVVSHAAAGSTTVDRTTEFTVGTTTTRNWVHVWPALVNTMFVGNLVGGATTDYLGVYATAIHRNVGTVACTDPTPDVAALNTAAGATAFTHFFVRQRTGADGFASGVGINNPRVAFTFLATTTVWGAGA